MGTSIQGWGYPESHLKVAFGMKPFVTPEPEPITQLTTPLICRTTGAGYVVVSANYIKETRNNLLTAYIYILASRYYWESLDNAPIYWATIEAHEKCMNGNSKLKHPHVSRGWASVPQAAGHWPLATTHRFPSD